MIIISKEKDVIVNLENIDAIGFKSNEFDKKTIIAHLVGGNSVEIGSYETEEEAKKVFETLIEQIEEKYCNIYEMPTEDKGE